MTTDDQDTTRGAESYRVKDAPGPQKQVYRVSNTEVRVRHSSRALNIPATLGGTLAAIGSLVLLSGLLGAMLGTVGYQTGVRGAAQSSPSVGSLRG
jgi:hypothetical protein